jgi:hypothetical protein
MNKSDVNLIQKFRRDLFRFNDPTVTWGEDERYQQYLAWGRATITFAVLLVLGGLLAWSYVQLRQDPYQQFLQRCHQQGNDDTTCSSHWERIRS